MIAVVVVRGGRCVPVATTCSTSCSSCSCSAAAANAATNRTLTSRCVGSSHATTTTTNTSSDAAAAAATTVHRTDTVDATDRRTNEIIIVVAIFVGAIVVRLSRIVRVLQWAVAPDTATKRICVLALVDRARVLLLLLRVLLP
jgi:hypothetical protein